MTNLPPQDQDVREDLLRRHHEVSSTIRRTMLALLSERTKEGLEASKRRARVGGRPCALTVGQKVEVLRMRDEEGKPIGEIAALFKVSESTVRRV